MLVGGLWVYSEPHDRVERFDPYQPVAQTPDEAAALSEWQGAQRAFDRARRTEKEARRNLELPRGLVMVALFVLQDRLRRRRSRYLTVGFAFLAFATAQALVMAVDYTTDYIDVGEVGPAVSRLPASPCRSLPCCPARHLAKRFPASRVKRRECPVCAYPVSDNRFCEGCGREVIGECSTC